MEGVVLGFESELNLPDPDPVATQEWVDSILAVRNQLGNEEARRLLLATCLLYTSPSPRD